MLVLIILWLICGMVVGYIATQRNRGFWNWLLVSMILTPLVGVLILISAEKAGKRCPACREIVKIDATKCRYCGSEVPKESTDIVT